MSTQPFDPVRYKAGQRWEWDTAVLRLKDWEPLDDDSGFIAGGKLWA